MSLRCLLTLVLVGLATFAAGCAGRNLGGHLVRGWRETSKHKVSSLGDRQPRTRLARSRNAIQAIPERPRR